MRVSITEIQNTISTMSEQQRGTLAAWLMESLPPHDGQDATEEGIEEATRRREELDSGNVRALSSDEFWASIRRDRAAWE